MRIDQVALLPAYCAAGTAVLALLADLIVARRAVTVAATMLGTVATAVAAVAVGRGGARATFCIPGAGCSYAVDARSALVALLFAVLTLGVLGLSAPALAATGSDGAPALPAGEYCFLLACSMTGGVVLGGAGDLLTLIVALETLTLPLYLLVGLRRTSLDSAGGAVTFFLVSVVATAVTLLGAGLFYASTGVVYFRALADAPEQLRAIQTVAVVALLGGLAFKVAAVPVHAWAPATYDGAPVPIAAYLSTASKLGGVIAILAVLDGLFDPRLDVAGPVLALLAILTMTVGNIGALRQTRMVRLLAWSSVAQAGYILAPLGAYALVDAKYTPLGLVRSGPVQLYGPELAALSYTVLYVLLEIAAFAAVVALRGARDGGSISDYRGAGRGRPWVGAAFTLALAGLAGLPPGLAGLFAKLIVVRSLLVDSAWWLALIVAANAVLGLAYYVWVVAVLYTAPEPALAPAVDAPAFAAPGQDVAPATGTATTVTSATAATATTVRTVTAAPDAGRARLGRPALAVAVVLAGATAVLVVVGFAPQLVLDALTP